jgi:hypothetical protein
VVGVGAFEQDHPGGLIWIPDGTTFGFDDLVHFRGKGEVPFEEVAPRIDLILTGPHATGAIPRELAPFLEHGTTQRQEHDFSDMTTSDLCKRWVEVEVDEHEHVRAGASRGDELLSRLRGSRRLRVAG